MEVRWNVLQWDGLEYSAPMLRLKSSGIDLHNSSKPRKVHCRFLYCPRFWIGFELTRVRNLDLLDGNEEEGILCTSLEVID